MARAAVVAPSLLACDFGRLAEEARDVLEKGGDNTWLHVDVMDGHFVPSINFGPIAVAALRRHLPAAYLDVHLMVDNPERHVQAYADAGASGFTFHAEATDDPRALVAAVRAAGMRAGVAVRPATELSEDLVALAADVDLFLVMSVVPGKGGQKYMPEVMSKARRLRDAYPALDIEVDGGLNTETVKHAAAHGANVIVAGSAVFKAGDRGAVIASLRSSVAAEAR